mgnify:CR=1 FL=1
MKKVIIRVLFALMVFSSTLCVAQAASARDSLLIRRVDAYAISSGGTITVYVDLTGTSSMDEIGASSIIVERLNGSSWVPVKTFSPSNTAGMISYSARIYNGSVSFTPANSGTYRAVVTVYAKSNGTTDSRVLTTNTV